MDDVKGKKSLLERTNSWKPFIDEVEGAVKARDFQKKTIRSILRLIDPHVSMWPGSLWNFLRGACIGSGFPYGRKLLYEIPFERFEAKKGRVFENAPLQAIQAFNALIVALFPKDVVTPLLIDEKLARRIVTKSEEILRKSEKSRNEFIKWGREIERKHIIGEKSSPVVPPSPPPKLEVSAPSVPPPLFSRLSLLDDETKAKIEEIVSAHEAIDAVDHGRQVIAILEDSVERFRLDRQKILVSLSSSPQLLTFRDLADQAKSVPRIAFSDEFLEHCFQLEDLSAVNDLVNAEVSEALRPFDSIIEKVERRSKVIKEIRAEKKRFEELIMPFLQRKELKGQTELLLSQLSTIEFPQTLFGETDSEEIEKAIAKKAELFKVVSKRIESQFRELIIQSRSLIRSADFLKMMVYAGRWELLGGKTPYQDLRAVSIRARDQLLQTIENDRTELVSGKISLSEYAFDLTAAIYEQDIKLIRGELTGRSFVLKDLRQAMVAELATLDRELALLFLSGSATEKALADRQWLSSFLYRLLSLYAIFKDVYDSESMNILFRYWWLDFEQFLKLKEERHTSFLHSAKDGALRFIRPIARTIDAIEKIEETGHHSMYQQFLEDTKDKAGVEAVSAIDNWLKESSKRGVNSWIPQLAFISQVDQEPLIMRFLQVDRQTKDLIGFAKSIQAVKTFEPERIDSLLEVISIFPFVEFFDQPPLIRLQNQLSKMEGAIQMMSEELIMELGLLDKKARMESGYSINNLLPQTLLRVPIIISSLTERFHALQQLKDPYVSSIAHFLIEDTVQLSRSFEAITGFDQEQLFAAFQKMTVLLFHRKMLDNAIQPKNFARILLLPTAIGQIVKRFRQMEERGELSAVASLIDELDGISAGQWGIVTPDLLKKNELIPKLQKCIVLAKRILTTSGLMERRESLLTTGIEKVCQELSEDIIFDIPRLSFVPGDLEYFWHSSEPLA